MKIKERGLRKKNDDKQQSAIKTEKTKKKRKFFTP